MKDKCPFCSKQKDIDQIRCNNCDKVWQDGYSDGKDRQKHKLNEIISKLKTIMIKE